MYNFQTICRTCANKGELHSIFMRLGDVTIVHMLTNITDNMIPEDDGFPQQICSICIKKLETAFTYKKQCLEINIKFSEYLEAIKIKEEVIEPLDMIETKFDTTKKEIDGFWLDSPATPQSDTGELVKQEIENNQNILPAVEVKRRKPVRKRNHTCPFCNKNFTYTNLRFHLRTHTKEKPHKCDVCGQEFSIKGNFKRHMKIHTGEKPHKCNICDRRFIQATTLQDHIRIHTNETPFSCPMCGKSFKQAAQLRFHKRVKHGPNSPKIKSNIQKPTKKLKSGTFMCDLCYKVFSTRSILNTHLLIHGEKSYLCSECGKGFVNKYGLQSHIKSHTGEKPFRCSTCNKCFSQGASLKAHQLIHTGERPFKCNICSKSFKQKNHLKYHVRVHSGEKPYGCSVCGKHFSLNGTLTVHMRTHTGETPYVCSVCNKGFYDSSSMKKHKKKHFIYEKDIDKKQLPETII